MQLTLKECGLDAFSLPLLMIFLIDVTIGSRCYGMIVLCVQVSCCIHLYMHIYLP